MVELRPKSRTSDGIINSKLDEDNSIIPEAKKEIDANKNL